MARGGATPPRKIYIDLGSSWGNSLRLWEDDFGAGAKDVNKAQMVPKTEHGWEIYGFEAHPLIHGYVDKQVEYLNTQSGSASVQETAGGAAPTGSTFAQPKPDLPPSSSPCQL